MKYVKVYQSRHPEYLKIILKVLHENAIPARLRMQDDSIVEVPEKDYIKAKHYIADDQDIFMSTLDVDINERFSPKYEEEYARILKEDVGEEIKDPNNPDSFKYIFSLLLYIFSFISALVLNVVIKLDEELPLSAYNFLAIGLCMIASSFLMFQGLRIGQLKGSKTDPGARSQLVDIQQRMKYAVRGFWLVALSASYFFFSRHISAWQGLISGNEELMIEGVSFLSPIICVGASLYLLKIFADYNPDQKRNH